MVPCDVDPDFPVLPIHVPRSAGNIICYVLAYSNMIIKLASLFHRRHHHYLSTSRDTPPQSVFSLSKVDITHTRMRPPTRSTRSVRPSLNTNNARRSRNGAPGPSPSTSHPVAASRSSESSSEAAGSNNNPPKPKPQAKLQSIIVPTSAAADDKVDPSTSFGSDPAPPANANAPVVGCFPVLPPSTFVYENQNQSQNQSQSPSESFPLLSPSLSGVTGSVILGKAFTPPTSYVNRQTRDSRCVL
jgi:hypothetical protein